MEQWKVADEVNHCYSHPLQHYGSAIYFEEACEGLHLSLVISASQIDEERGQMYCR
jgi:hypothetical protein